MKYLNIIISVYIIIIILIIFYQVISSIKSKRRNAKEERIKRKFQEMIEKEIKHLKVSAIATNNHLNELEKSLNNTKNLIIFENVLTEKKKKNEKIVEEYCKSINSVFQYLSITYRKKNSLEKAYFTYVLALFPELIENKDDSIRFAMMHFVMDKSVYCRENAMLFFYKKNSEKLIVNSLKKMSSRNLYYSHTLLADDLLNFTGDKHALSLLLLQEFDKFNANFQLGIMNYLRFSEENFQEEIYKKWSNKKYAKEVRLAMIRYFATHKYEKFQEELWSLTEEKERDQYEYRLVACFALASYDNKKSREVLIECLCDINYYVRKNAAISLSRMKLTTSDIEKLEKLEDPYAKDMIAYVLSQKEKKLNRKDKR